MRDGNKYDSGPSTGPDAFYLRSVFFCFLLAFSSTSSVLELHTFAGETTKPYTTVQD
jgi:hypothetical protein